MRAILRYLKLFPFLCLSFGFCRSEILYTVGKSINQSDFVDNSDIQLPDSAGIFIAGGINILDKKTNAAYWKNGKEILLSNDHSFANDIAVYKDDIFVGGMINGNPCYWINGKCVVISTEGGFVSALGFQKGILHMVGLYRDGSNNIFYAFLWKNNTFTILSENANVSDIAFNEDDIYIAGIDEGKPCYWKNQVKIILSDHIGIANDIEIANNNILAAGEFRPDNGEDYISGYWKNKEFISVGNHSTYIWNVAINKDKVYLVGSQIMEEDSIKDQAIIIEGNVKKVLNVPDNASAVAINIDFHKDDKYIIGNCIMSTKPTLSSQVCYWKNDQIHIIGRPGSVCSSIFIEPDL